MDETYVTFHSSGEAPGDTPHRPRRRPSRLFAWILLLIVGVSCIAFVANALRARAEAGVGLPDFSVYSDGRDGYAQAAELLRRLGWRPVAVTRPIQQTRHRGLLILAEPDDPLAAEFGTGLGLPQRDVEGLLEWVSQGNTLLYFASRNTSLYFELAVRINNDPAPTDTVYKATAGAVGQYTLGIQHIGLERPVTVSGAKAVPLWWLGSRPAAVALRHGNGRVLIVADPSIFTHRGLLREDNAVFLYNVAALDSHDGRVYFDEFHHGIRSGGGYWSYLRYHDQQWIVLQLLLVGLVGFWAVGRRLGPAVPMPVTMRADAVDYAASVARIYEKADTRPLVAGIYALNFLDAVTQHLRLRRGAAQGEIVAAWKQRHGPEATGELTYLLNEAQSLTQGEPVGNRALLSLAKRFDFFLRNAEPRAIHRRRT